MAQTLCPLCDKPATFVDSERIGMVVTRELGMRMVTERKIHCPACSKDEDDILVFWRIDLFQGTETKRTVSH